MKTTEEKEARLLAKNIQDRRKKQGFSSAEAFAEAAGLSASVIKKIESGINFPRQKTLIAIANALECGISDLFERKENTASKSVQALADIIEEQQKEIDQAKEVIEILNSIKEVSPNVLADLYTISQEPDPNYRNSLFKVLEEAAKASRMSKDHSFKLKGIQKINSSMVAETYFKSIEDETDTKQES